MKFKAGQSGNPGGRPKGCSGRMQALAILDVLMIHARNRRALKSAMQKAFDAIEFTGNKGLLRVWFLSADNPDSIRRFGFQGLVIDEAAVIPQAVWHYVLRPTISQTLGWAVQARKKKLLSAAEIGLKTGSRREQVQGRQALPPGYRRRAPVVVNARLP